MTNIPGPDTVTVPDTAINPDTVLSPTTWCVVREQRAEYLVYNSRTDELHLISPMGRYLYLLCDGLRTVAEIQALLPQAAGAAIPEFLAGLVTRGLVEPVPPPNAGRGAP
jgi:hypothetical protein